MKRFIVLALTAALPAISATQLRAAAPEVNVSNSSELQRALAGARPGTVIRLAPGRYEGGIYTANLQGSAEAPIVIEGADPGNLPRFEHGRTAIQLAGCSSAAWRRSTGSRATEAMCITTRFTARKNGWPAFCRKTAMPDSSAVMAGSSRTT